MIEKVAFLSDGQEVRGTLVAPEVIDGQKPGVIFFHGMTSSERGYIPIAEELAKNGIVGLALSIRGHGSSEGNFDNLTIDDAVEDGLSAYDFFARLDYVDKNRIGLCGASVGAAISSIVSEQRKVSSLVLRAPATYTDEMMRMTFEEIMTEEGQIFSRISNIEDTPALKAIARFEGSVLVVTSEKDVIIPLSIPTAYFKRAQRTKKRERFEISQATHNLSNGLWRQQFINETIKWFIETL